MQKLDFKQNLKKLIFSFFLINAINNHSSWIFLQASYGL